MIDVLVLKVRSAETELRISDVVVKREVRHFLDLLRYQLDDAVVAYNFRVVAWHNGSIDEGMEGHRAREHHLMQLAETIGRLRSAGQAFVTNTDEDRAEAERLLRLQEWEAGRPNRVYWNRLSHQCLRAQVLAVHTFRELAEDLRNAIDKWRAASALTRQELKSARVAAGKMVTSIDNTFPRLRDVRDSLHHPDERGRGLVRDEPIPLKPVEGGSLLLNLGSTDSNGFSVTVGDGSNVYIPIDAASIETLAQLNDAFVAALPLDAWAVYQVI